MNLSTLIAEIGDEHIKIQRLDESLLNATTSKKGTKLTVITREINCANIAHGTGPIGLIIWIPRDKIPASLNNRKD